MAQQQQVQRLIGLGYGLLSGGLVLLGLAGCGHSTARHSTARHSSASSDRAAVMAQSRSPATVPVVDIAPVQSATAIAALRYTGTTTPAQTVEVRSRTEGQVLSMNADVGDRVQQGAPLAQLDTALIQGDVNEAKAEWAARQFEVEQAKAERAEAQTAVERARAEWQQAQADAERFESLAAENVVPAQTAELAQTTARTTQQILKAAEQQVSNRNRAIDSAVNRVAAQQAIVEQALSRLSHAQINAPLTGTVLARQVDSGTVMQPGQVLLTIGDLSAIHVEIQVSDHDLTQFTLGQTVNVQLDAFPNQTWQGTVSQISPVADAVARLIPIEITLLNPNRQIASGLMARVEVPTQQAQTVLIPPSALEVAASPPQAQIDRETQGKPISSATHSSTTGMVWVPVQTGSDLVVEAREVQLGQRINDQIEVLDGLDVGEALVIGSTESLEAGQGVRPSVLSEF